MLRAIRQLGDRWPFSVPTTIVGAIVVTYGLAALVARELGQPTRMGSLSSLAYVVCGALDPDNRMGPRYWTTWFTAAFLHGGLFHLIMNSMSILQLGRLLDVLTMPRNTLLAFLAGTVGGSAAVMGLAWLTGGGSVTIGASSGACGILGALLGLTFRARGSVLTELRRELIMSTVILIAIGFAPGISAMGHAGGLVAGILCGLVMRNRGSIRLARDPWTSGPDIAAFILTVACLVALGIQAYRVPDDIKILKSTRPLESQFDTLEKWVGPRRTIPSEAEVRDWVMIQEQLKLPRAYVPIAAELQNLATASGCLEGRVLSQEQSMKYSAALDQLHSRFIDAVTESNWFGH